MRRLYVCLALLLAAIVVNCGHSSAAPNQKITITPFLQTVQIQADEPTKTFDLTITNSTQQPQQFHLSVLNFGSLNETGGLVFAGNNSSTLIKKYGLAPWLRLSVNDLGLGAGESTTVQATIINDTKLSPGGHYGAVVASVNSNDALGGNQVNVKQQLSSLILLTKIGGEKYDLSLSSISYGSGWGRLPSSVELRFKNQGNVQVVPRGIVKLVSPRGHVVRQGVINEASSYVLPETYRRIPVELASVGEETWWPKFYRLVVYYRYDGINSFASKSYTLYLVNWPAMLIFGATLVLILYGIYRLFKYLIWRRSRPKPVPLVAYRKPANKAAKRPTKKSPKKTKKRASKKSK